MAACKLQQTNIKVQLVIELVYSIISGTVHAIMFNNFLSLKNRAIEPLIEL